MLTAEVRPEVTDSALVEIQHQLDRLRNEPVSQQELDAAKGFLTGSFPVSIQTAAQVASQIATTKLLGLTIESLLQHRALLEAVSAAEVQRVARTYLGDNRAETVVVGDAPLLRERLQEIAPVRVLDLKGNAVSLD